MKSIFYKEFRLVIGSCYIVFLFSLLSAMVFIPSYPSIVALSYFIFTIQIIFQTSLTNKDEKFSVMLPVPKNYIIIGKMFTVVVMQMSQIFVAVICSVIKVFVLNAGTNPIGMDVNLAFFGFAFIYFALFNLAFFPLFFRTGYKLGLPFLVSVSVYFITALVFEFTVAFAPSLNKVFDGFDKSMLPARIATLLCGMAIYIGCLFASYKISVEKYKKVSI